VTEIVWQAIPDGDFRVKWGLKDLKTRKPHRFDFDADEFGNLPQKTVSGRTTADGSTTRLVRHLQPRPGILQLVCESDLHGRLSSLVEQRQHHQVLEYFLGKVRHGIPFLHPAEGKSIINEPAFTSLKNAIINLQATSAIAMQAVTRQSTSWNPAGGRVANTMQAIAYHDRAISRGLLMPTGLGFSEDTVSGSLASHASTLTCGSW